MSEPRYRVLEHTADSAVLAYGATPAEAFANAAFAMFDLTFELEGIEPQVERVVEAAGENPAEALVAWLSELLAIAEIEDLVFTEFVVAEAGEEVVRGRARGAPAAGLELKGPPIKAVTHHDVALARDPDGWSVRVIFDV